MEGQKKFQDGTLRQNLGPPGAHFGTPGGLLGLILDLFGADPWIAIWWPQGVGFRAGFRAHVFPLPAPRARGKKATRAQTWARKADPKRSPKISEEKTKNLNAKHARQETQDTRQETRDTREIGYTRHETRDTRKQTRDTRQETQDTRHGT